MCRTRRHRPCHGTYKSLNFTSRNKATYIFALYVIQASGWNCSILAFKELKYPSWEDNSNLMANGAFICVWSISEVFLCLDISSGQLNLLKGIGRFCCILFCYNFTVFKKNLQWTATILLQHYRCPPYCIMLKLVSRLTLWDKHTRVWLKTPLICWCRCLNATRTHWIVFQPVRLRNEGHSSPSM